MREGGTAAENMPRSRERLSLKRYLSGLKNGLHVSNRARSRTTRRWLHKAAAKPCMGQLTEEQASKLYQQQVEDFSPHWTAYRDGNAASFPVGGAAFWVWAIGKGYAKMNPWMKSPQSGEKANVGKPQLRIDEAQKARSGGDAESTEWRPSITGCVADVVIGTPAGEVAARVVRDIDDDGRVLWIPSGEDEECEASPEDS